MIETSITSANITEFAKCCKNTSYAKLMDGIAMLTESIENEHLFNTPNEDALEHFRGTYNKKFHQLFDRLFAPLKVQSPLPQNGQGNYDTEQGFLQISRVEHMNGCVFVDGEPRMFSAIHSTNRDTALSALERKLPEGYDVEFVCNTHDASTVVAIGQARRFYYLNANQSNGFKPCFNELTQSSLHGFPLMLLTPKQCDEMHIKAFVKGFVDCFNAMYSKCDWNLFTDGFKEVVYAKFSEYSRIWSYRTTTSKRDFMSILKSYAKHNHTNRFSMPSFIEIQLLYDEQTIIQLEYMKAFCYLYQKKFSFPALDDIQRHANDSISYRSNR